MAGSLIGGLTMYKVYGAGEGRDTWVWLDLETAARVAVMVWYIESRGGTLYLSEGYRPTGSEYPDRFVTSASKTSLGISTQWYQVGRMDRRETPSAIIPNASGSNLSRHRIGRALDSNAPTARDMQLRAEGAALVGLVFNVASESWHQEPLGAIPTGVDLAPWYALVKGDQDSKQEVTPPKPNPNRLKEANPMYLVVENDTKAPRIFIMLPTGAYHLTSTDEVAAYLDHFAGLGLTGDGYSKAMPKSSKSITLISQAAEGQARKVLNK